MRSPWRCWIGCLEVGCSTAVTTHLGALKHYGFTHDAAVNVAMDFDTATGRPNYRVPAGVCPVPAARSRRPKWPGCHNR